MKLKYKKSISFAICLGLVLGYGFTDKGYASSANSNLNINSKLFDEADENIAVTFKKKNNDNIRKDVSEKKNVKLVAVKKVVLREKVVSGDNESNNLNKASKSDYVVKKDIKNGVMPFKKHINKDVNVVDVGVKSNVHEKDAEIISVNKEDLLLKAQKERDELLEENKRLEQKLKEQDDIMDEAIENSRKELLKENERLEQKLTKVVVEQELAKKTNFKDVVKDEADKNSLVDPLIVGDFNLKSFEASNDGSIIKGIDSEPTLREESEVEYLDYVNGMMNTINTKVGYTTVVILPEGEKLQRVTVADRERFKISNVFDKFSNSWHVYIQPLQSDLETNIILATDQHMFNATLKSSYFFKPFVKWINVPGGTINNNIPDDGFELSVKNIDQLYFKYQYASKEKYSWTPLNIFDDKVSHTFISFDEKALTRYTPVIFTRTVDGGVKLLPFSRYKNTFILDAVYDNIEIRVNNNTIRYNRKS